MEMWPAGWLIGNMLRVFFFSTCSLENNSPSLWCQFLWCKYSHHSQFNLPMWCHRRQKNIQYRLLWAGSCGSCGQMHSVLTRMALNTGKWAAQSTAQFKENGSACVWPGWFWFLTFSLNPRLTVLPAVWWPEHSNCHFFIFLLTFKTEVTESHSETIFILWTKEIILHFKITVQSAF